MSRRPATSETTVGGPGVARRTDPVAVAAGLSTLKLVQMPGFYEALAAQTSRLSQGLQNAAQEAAVTFCADSIGGMFGLYFADSVPTTYTEMMKCDVVRFNAFFHAMLDAGVYFAPSAFEAGFVSAQHDDMVIDATINTARSIFGQIS